MKNDTNEINDNLKYTKMIHSAIIIMLQIKAHKITVLKYTREIFIFKDFTNFDHSKNENF